jgi:ribonuclease R
VVPGVGDRILARVSHLDAASVLDESGEHAPSYEGVALKILPREAQRALGIFRAHARGGGEIAPIDRRAMRSYVVHGHNTGGAEDGDLVRFDLARTGRFGASDATIVERIGNPRDQRQTSLIAIHANGIPDTFPGEVLREADRLSAATSEGRTDLRDTPLITIDPADARDHDDAVWAAPDASPANPGGHVVLVAIADVAHYVRPGSRLDREAELRGNSVYFPDRVVPMLPERISNDLCSLREGEDRACLAVRLVFDAQGHRRKATFVRGIMRSAAKLSYQDAQAAIDGTPSDRAQPLVAPVLEPLWAAYRTLRKAREARGPLELEIPERKIIVGADGRVEKVVVPERLDAHRLIEEMMIQANVAAAEVLEERRTTCVYRVHDKPDREKLDALRDFLASLGLSLPKASELSPSHINGVLARAREMPVADLVNEIVLRSQAQAVYAIENIGHFGLSLRRYAHFTSPIRRYADLLVHRALIRALGFGGDGLPKDAEGRLADVARAISMTERRAMAAERETADRLIAAFLADRVGAELDARVSGLTRGGLFVRLNETGADGFVPAETLGGDYWRHDEALHAMVGDRTGLAFRLGDAVRVRLVEAVATAGALRFEMLSEARRLREGGHAGRRRGGGSFRRSRSRRF